MGSKAGFRPSLLTSAASSSSTTAAAAPRRISPPSADALTPTILNHLRFGRLSKAVSVLFSSAVPFPFSLYADLLRVCASENAVTETRKLECHLLTFNPDPPSFLLNRVIESYGKCGSLVDARELFEQMPNRDGGSWNAIIGAHSRNELPRAALGLFAQMAQEGVRPSEVTLATVLGSCRDLLELWMSRKVHGLVVKYGYVGNIILESSLVDVYGKCGVMADARRMFDDIENPNDITWNVIIRRYLDTGQGSEGLKMFREMVRTKVNPLCHTVSNAILACSGSGGVRVGIQIHGYSVKINLECDEVVTSTLIGMYSKCGDLESTRRIFDYPDSKHLINYTSLVSGYATSGRLAEARAVFDEMPERTVISWNVMLAGYTRVSKWDEALAFVMLMRKKTRDMDHVTLGLILNICAAIPDLELGKQAHGYAYRQGYHSNLYVANALLDMYGKCGNLNKARVWFYQISHLRDKVSWNALLTGHARHGLSEEAMEIFGKMLEETKPSKFTFATLLAACANIYALEFGKQVHAFMVRNHYDFDIVINGALVNMYLKCRCIEYAMRVFEWACSKDVILFNSMILGCSHNGMGSEVVRFFEEMESEGFRPDHVTFQGVLRACISEGWVELGKRYFELMSDKYYLSPQVEHYDSIIELYGHHGLMDELEVFVKEMPFDPTVRMLTKVVDFSREYECLRLGEWACSRLNELNPPVPFQFDIADNA
ncbi:Pentatricopeptide repeat-containing protein [Striga hermonthica]|uniref:Pentatricopeptide repeat-containing protein n=1 Tax=Striga hermonthica TaxID=68872 RepID=A0A9N7MH42_STRHE|nr:Pentatricopeptide repeat-containing protein [Striga hermonthica]